MWIESSSLYNFRLCQFLCSLYCVCVCVCQIIYWTKRETTRSLKCYVNQSTWFPSFNRLEPPENREKKIVYQNLFQCYYRSIDLTAFHVMFVGWLNWTDRLFALHLTIAIKHNQLILRLYFQSVCIQFCKRFFKCDNYNFLIINWKLIEINNSISISTLPSDVSMIQFLID